MITAQEAMGQAKMTAHDYFLYLRVVVEEWFPKASADAKLAAVTELCKVAAQDFHSWQIGNVADQVACLGADYLERLRRDDD